MPRVIFLKDFDYKPVSQQTFSYKEGDVVLLKQDIADLVISEKVAELTELRSNISGITNTIKKFPNKKKQSAAPKEADEASNLLEDNSLSEKQILSEDND